MESIKEKGDGKIFNQESQKKKTQVWKYFGFQTKVWVHRQSTCHMQTMLLRDKYSGITTDLPGHLIRESAKLLLSLWQY